MLFPTVTSDMRMLLVLVREVDGADIRVQLTVGTGIPNTSQVIVALLVWLTIRDPGVTDKRGGSDQQRKDVILQ